MSPAQTLAAHPAETTPEPGTEPEGILVVRRGPGANCSSIGSAVEMLFLSATVGAAVLGALAAVLRPRTALPADAHADEPPSQPSVPQPSSSREPRDPTEAG